MKVTTLISFSAILTFFIMGCRNYFPESRVFQNVDMRTILFKERQESGQSQFQYSINVSEEYVFKDCRAVVILTGGGKNKYLQDVIAECKAKITQSGGQIVGEGTTSDLSRQELMFNTSKTTGQIILYGSSINETNLQMNAIVFECQR